MSFRNRMSIPHNFNKLLLIKLVHQRPALWDRTVDSYKNKFSKTAAWHEVCGILKKDYNNLNGTERQNYYKLVIKIWTHTRDSWARSLNARKNSKKNGSFVRPYKYHKEMLFLKKIKGRRFAKEADDAEDEEQEEEEEIIAESESDSAAVCENEWNVDSKEDIDLSAMNQENTTNEIDNTENRQDNNISEDILNAKMQAYLNNQMKQMRKPTVTHDDRHFAFFKSVHPTLTLLDDDQILEFQSGVINLLRNIKSGGRFQNVVNNQPSLSSSRGYYSQSEAPDVSQQPLVGPRVIQIPSSSAGSGRPQPRIERDPLKSE